MAAYHTQVQDIIDAGSAPTLRVTAEGTGPVADVFLIRGNRAYTRQPGRSHVDIPFLETVPEPGTHFYHVRLEQADGHMA